MLTNLKQINTEPNTSLKSSKIIITVGRLTLNYTKGS